MTDRIQLLGDEDNSSQDSQAEQFASERLNRGSRTPPPRKPGSEMLLISLLFFLLAGGGVYLYLNYVEPAKKTEAPPPKPPAAVEDNRNNIVLIQGRSPNETYMSYQEGGTGFIMEWKGKVFLVTNIHVLAGLDEPHFLTLSGKEVDVNLDNLFLARDEDVAIVAIDNYRDIFPERVEHGGDDAPKADAAADTAEVADTTEDKTADSGTDKKAAAPVAKKKTKAYAYQPFELLENVEFEVDDGDKITVYGNTLGKRLVQERKGNIKGMGHNIFRHTAKVEPGNSGSPVIHDNTGDVIGIVTYAVFYFEGEFKKEMYAYRLDNIEHWEAVGSWDRFKHISEKYDAIQQRTYDLWALSNGEMDINVYKDIKLRNVFNTLNDRLEDIRSGRVAHSTNTGDMASRAYQHFLTSVENLLWEDISTFLSDTTREWGYNYFRIQVLEQKEYREYIRQNIEMNRFVLK